MLPTTDILPDESVEDLQFRGFKLIQKKEGFRFGTDAVLLSDFAKKIHSKNTLDLCAGSGIVPILLAGKTNTPTICGLEIQTEIAEMAKRSVELNSLQERVKITEGDLKNALDIYPQASFDLITCNPPYMKTGSAILNKTDNKIISRHEVMCTLEDILNISEKLLKPMGHLVMVHRPNRLVDVLAGMREHSIEPKTIRFVHPSSGKPPILFLVDGMRGANRDIKILEPLYLYDSDGKESEKLKKIYERE